MAWPDPIAVPSPQTNLTARASFPCLLSLLLTILDQLDNITTRFLVCFKSKITIVIKMVQSHVHGNEVIPQKMSERFIFNLHKVREGKFSPYRLLITNLKAIFIVEFALSFRTSLSGKGHLIKPEGGMTNFMQGSFTERMVISYFVY